jgi:hypothetical protein
VLTPQYCAIVTELMKGGNVRELIDRHAPNGDGGGGGGGGYGGGGGRSGGAQERQSKMPRCTAANEFWHQEERLPWSTRLMVARDAALGMVYLHGFTEGGVKNGGKSGGKSGGGESGGASAGVWHRDLKSQNLLVDDPLRPTVTKVCVSVSVCVCVCVG